MNVVFTPTAWQQYTDWSIILTRIKISSFIHVNFIMKINSI